MAVRKFLASDIEAVRAVVPERDVSIHNERIAFEARGGGRYLLGLDDARPAGFVLLRSSEGNQSEWRQRFGCAEVEDLYVASSARGRGLGRELMVAAEDAAREQGVALIGLATFSEAVAQPARRLYESLGYVDLANGPWIESWAKTDDDGVRKIDHEMLESYFVKSLR
jgi:GNAT superfamily N-acetyltransferase